MSEQSVDADRVARPSREEIETLCIVHVVSERPRSYGELAESLGLSRELGSAMEEAVAPLVRAGRVEVVNDIVRATEVGRAWLGRRLAELYVASEV